ncbi:MAG: hypothetical protein SVU69_01970 [Pseudomonadota bacterium]|nr:hypothetical protein [Pseudomonadota bacterium]
MTVQNHKSHYLGLVSPRAVLYGVMAYLFGTVVVSISISGATRAYLSAQGMDEARIRAFFGEQFDSPLFVLIGFLPSLLVFAIAGFVSARAARKLPYWHALATILVALAFSFAPVISQVPVWFTFMNLIGAVIAALAGAYWCQSRFPTSSASG